MTDQTLLEHKARQRAEADAFLADPAVHTPRYLPVLIVAPTATRVRIAQPGEVFYDAAGFVSVQCVTNAAKVGDHVSLYMGGRYGCTRAHVEAAWAEGAGVVPNWERNPDQALKGYADGRAAVDSAMITAALWGMDTTQIPVAYSGVDFGPTASQYSVLDQWHRGVQDRSDELGVAQPVVYGYTAYLLHLSQQPWWRGGTWVWAGSGTFNGMTVKQRLTPTRDVSYIGCTVDEDLVATNPSYPLVVWTGEGLDPEETDVTPDEMRTVVHETMTGILRADEFRLNAAIVEALIRLEANFPLVIHETVTGILRADEFKLNAAIVAALTRIEEALPSVDGGGVAPHNHNVTGTAT